MNDITIRLATIQDHEMLLSFEQSVIEAERPFNPSLKDKAFYYDIRFLLSDNKTRLIVGEASGQIVATGYIQIRQSKQALKHDRHGYLGFMYVAPAYRGQEINKLILQDLIDWATNQGITDFYLDVYARNIAAINAYKKIGFEPSLLEMKLNLNNKFKLN